MEQQQDLLVEIGTEELPPTALSGLSAAFVERMRAQLADQRLSHGAITGYASPRRLALLVEDLSVRQRDEESVRRGPALSAAFDAAGAPTKAALGFARSCGVDVGDLEREESAKGAWLIHRQQIVGARTAELLPAMVESALSQLPVNKRMRWGSGNTEFVRPVHWICLLFGGTPVDGQVLGIDIARESRGHRFHHPGPVPVDSPAAYADALRAAFVEPSFQARRSRIREQVEALAASVGGQAAISEALLDEVTALCEWPVALLGQFDPEFLDVPAEALIETMQKNQKYFPVLDAGGGLRPSFIAVANIESREPEVVRRGNERVIRPRFADAKFFWEQDRKRALADRQQALSGVVFQQRLGSIWDKSQRVARLSRWIAGELGDDVELAGRAALLGKCDLVTLMVGEFASLQGVMGRYYAQHDGEDPCVASAMEEQYLPRQAGDRLPESPCGRAVALADKLDTLVGIFAVGQRPSGVKDPYGLRRAAIGVLRILTESPLELDLRQLIEQAAAGFPDGIDAGAAVDAVYEYMMDRLPAYYGDRGVRTDVVDAVVASGSTVPSDIDRRMAAVLEFRRLDAAEALAAANKRIRNILRKSDADSRAVHISADYLSEPAERQLAARLDAIRGDIDSALSVKDYGAVLRILATLRGDVDTFFDEVMVLAEDPAVRDNRIALLREVERLFMTVADISLLQPEAAPA